MTRRWGGDEGQSHSIGDAGLVSCGGARITSIDRSTLAGRSKTKQRPHRNGQTFNRGHRREH